MCNTVQLVVDSSGDVIVPMYDWCSFFATTFKKLPSIKTTHHFRMSEAHPGKVFTKENCSSPEVEHCLLKEGVVLDPEELPPVITPRGLPSQRQWYLYDKIREFCPAADQDITCPLPSTPRPTSRQGTPEPPSCHPHIDSPTTSPPAKRPRRCGNCGQPGHNRRSCPAEED